MTHSDIMCGEIRLQPVEPCPDCGATPVLATSRLILVQPIQPNIDQLQNHMLLQFDPGEKVLVVVQSVLKENSPMPSGEAMVEAIDDAKETLDWYKKMVQSGDFCWYNPGTRCEDES